MLNSSDAYTMNGLFSLCLNRVAVRLDILESWVRKLWGEYKMYFGYVDREIVSTLP